jgi:TRAP transporter TAXI family solute receptor
MRGALLAIVLLLASGTGAGAEGIMVTLGTATPGGGFPVYGDALAQVINEVDPTLEVRTRNTKGSTENVPLLEAGQLDLALVQGEVAHEALSGVGRAPSKLLLFSAMYTTPGMFVVRGDQPTRSIAELKGKSVVWGARGSGLVVLARYVLDGLGLPQGHETTAANTVTAAPRPDLIHPGARRYFREIGLIP